LLLLAFCVLVSADGDEPQFQTTADVADAMASYIRVQQRFPEIHAEFQSYCDHSRVGKMKPGSQAHSVMCLMNAFDRYSTTVFTAGTMERNEALARQHWFCKDPEFDSTRMRLTYCLGNLTIPGPHIDLTQHKIALGFYTACQPVMEVTMCVPTTFAMATLKFEEKSNEFQKILDRRRADDEISAKKREEDMLAKFKAELALQTQRATDANDELLSKAARIHATTVESYVIERTALLFMDFMVMTLLSKTGLAMFAPRVLTQNAAAMACTTAGMMMVWHTVVEGAAYLLTWILLLVRISVHKDELVAMTLGSIMLRGAALLAVRMILIMIDGGITLATLNREHIYQALKRRAQPQPSVAVPAATPLASWITAMPSREGSRSSPWIAPQARHVPARRNGSRRYVDSSDDEN
jgi:DNA-binding phage protein